MRNYLLLFGRLLNKLLEITIIRCPANYIFTVCRKFMTDLHQLSIQLPHVFSV